MKKTVGMIQSNYIPWRGYFDFIQSSDVFVIYDDVQFTHKDWRSRNKIKTAEGLRWLSVPVKHSSPVESLIQDAAICYDRDWIRKHTGAVQHAYKRAPFFHAYGESFFEILNARSSTISHLNVALIRWTMKILSIETPLLMSAEFKAEGRRTDRILDILRKLDATDYLVGPSAKQYIEVEKFKTAGIGLQYKSYSYPEYPQLHGEFQNHVSIIDLLFNCGTASRDYVQSSIPNDRVL